MNKVVVIFITILFSSCYNDEEVYYDSVGNSLNHSSTTKVNDEVQVDFIPYDSIKPKSISSCKFYSDGRVVIGGSRLLFDAFVLVVNAQNEIEFKVEIPEVKTIRSAKIDGLNNVVFFAGDSAVSYAYDGSLNWSKSAQEMFIDAELVVSYTVSPRVLLIEDNSDVVIFLDCIVGTSSRRIAVLRYSPEGNLVCNRRIDSDNKLFDDAAKTKNNMLLLAAGRTYSYEKDCSHSATNKGGLADYLLERNGSVSKARLEQKKLSVTYMAEDASELSDPLEIYHEIDPIRCLDLTIDEGFVLGGSYKESAFANETVLVEKFNSQGKREFNYSIKTNYEAKPASIYQNDVGQYSIIALKENKALVRMRFNK